MRLRLLATLALALMGVAACAPGGKKVSASTETYNQFFQNYNNAMKAIPGAKEVLCPYFSGPPLDYLYLSCFYYPSTTSMSLIQKTLSGKGFEFRSGSGGPKSLRIYDSKGGEYFISQREKEAGDGSILVGSLISDTGSYVGRPDHTGQWAEISLITAAQQIGRQLSGDKNKVIPCKDIKTNTVCLSINDKIAFLSELSDRFYAGEFSNFLKKYRAGPFEDNGDDIWKPGDSGYGSVTIKYEKEGRAEVFDGKQGHTYRNMLFKVVLEGKLATITARFRPGYTPVQ